MPLGLCSARRRRHRSWPLCPDSCIWISRWSWQYGHWISGIFSGSFGNSLVSHEPVGTLLHERFLNSGFLILVAGLIAIPLGAADRGIERNSSR